MIKVWPGWEFNRICFDLTGLFTAPEVKMGERGEILSTCHLDLTLLESKAVLEELTLAIQEYEKIQKSAEDYFSSLEP